MKKLSKEYQKAVLELSNGAKFEGRLMGSAVCASGEMVFTTGMVGYNEAITDPSYKGQILVFSFALIGNYGIPPLKEGDFFMAPGYESDGIKPAGIVISDGFHDCFHYKGGMSLDAWLKKQNVPAIVGVDTRALVKMLRTEGSPLLARILPVGPSAQTCTFFDPKEHNLIPQVSVKERTIVGKGDKRVAVLDCGVKWGVIRNLVEQGLEVELLPWDTNPDDIEASGWVISSGPGNPENSAALIENAKKILEKNVPVLGIGFGHQILALAAGAKVERLPLGHRGENQPVYDNKTKKGYMTSQNHSYAVTKESLPKGWKVTMTNANDGTVAGISAAKGYVKGVQFNPEGSTDTTWIFKDFADAVRRVK
ncbi:carbamoyl-phosphate synthase small subunit [Elusimicrobium posterum]|uniref:glutamine-hydrolyzing carbamoyl-phosphate synthase small subunit n=1 Tax=Elusimicrobium posterum TaxID=3116653 RepID=UPI003C720F19